MTAAWITARCPQCVGSGTLVYYGNDSGSGDVDAGDLKPCTECGGTGEIEVLAKAE